MPQDRLFGSAARVLRSLRLELFASLRGA